MERERERESKRDRQTESSLHEVCPLLKVLDWREHGLALDDSKQSYRVTRRSTDFTWLHPHTYQRSSCTTQLMFSDRPQIYASCMTISGGRTEQHAIIAGLLLRHWLYEWFSRAEQLDNML